MVTEPLTVASISNPANSNNNSSYNIIRNNSIIVVLKLFILMDVIIPNMKCLHRRSVTILPLSSTLQVSLVLDRDFDALLHPIKPIEFSLVFVVVNLVIEFILLPFI